MSIMMRFGSVAPLCALFLCGYLAAAAPVAAEEKPAAWTDPPLRGAAAPQASGIGKSEESLAPKPSSGRAEGATAIEATKTQSNASRNGKSETSMGRKGDRLARSARLRQDQTRRVSARMRPGPEQSVVFRKVVSQPDIAERSLKASSVRPVAHSQAKVASRAAPNLSHWRQMSRRDVFAERYGRRPVGRFDEDIGGDGDGYGPYRAARGGDPFDDDRADRIASARAAGYLVMRSRAYTYSDGSRFRSVRPYFPDDPSGFE